MISRNRKGVISLELMFGMLVLWNIVVNANQYEINNNLKSELDFIKSQNYLLVEWKSQLINKELSQKDYESLIKGMYSNYRLKGELNE